MRSWTLRIPWAGKLPNLNRRTHWAQGAKVKQEMHTATFLMCRLGRVPKGLDRVEVAITVVPKDRRRRDTDNLAPVVKAICDAISEGHPRRPGYGVVPDDTPQHMTRPELVIADPNPGDPHLMVVITELPKEPT